jgi:anti-anti-sigma factor
MQSEKTYSLSFDGDLSSYAAAGVDTALPSPAAYTRVVIDCTAVTSMDSSIVAVFMRFRKSFIAAGNDPHNIVILGSAQLRAFFDLTGLARFVTVIYPGGQH